MGLPNTSRKGKKAWRKNIDTSEIVEAVQQETHQKRRGPAVETLQDSQLFFEDKGASVAEVRPRAKKEKRLTRAQLILQAPQAITAVTTYKNPKRKAQPLPPPRQVQKQAEQQQDEGKPAKKKQKVSKAAAVQTALNLWEGLEGADGSSPAAPKPLSTVGPTSRVGVPKNRPLPAPLIKAVEVDMPGCSYNPERESHQDALAVLVAAENKKLLHKELRPAPIPLTFTTTQHEGGDELAMLQTEAAPDEEEEEEEEQVVGAAGEEAAGKGAGKNAAAASAPNKKTKKDRNREARVAAEAQLIEQRKALKRQRTLLQNLPSIVQEVQEEEQHQEALRIRKQVVKEEKAASQPPRLGKLKFEDLSVQVLTSDEVGQGLRRLKPFPMLATERFKSLQKRGLIEPRRPVGTKASKKRIQYETGARREKVEEGQANLEALKKTNRAVAKASKKQA